MKNNRIYNTILVLFVGLMIFSCSQEDDLILTNESQQFNKISVLKYSNPIARGGQSSMLVFDTMETFKQTVSQLELQVEENDDAFLSEWGYLDDELLNAKEEEIAFEDTPLTIFENNFEFNSLRKKFLSEEENWLNNEQLDEFDSPLDKDIFDFDEFEMSILNQFGEFKIERAIYKKLTKNQVLSIKSYRSFPFNSCFIIINDGNLDDLVAFNNGDYSIINKDNFKILPDDPFDLPDFGGGTNYPDPNDDIFSTCKSNKVKTRFLNTGTNKKVWRKIKMGGRRAKAKLRSYKKKRRRWKKWRTYMEVAVKGAARPVYDCFYFEYVNKKRVGRKKRLKAVQVMPQSYKKVLQNELINISKHNGVESTLYLTW